MYVATLEFRVTLECIVISDIEERRRDQWTLEVLYKEHVHGGECRKEYSVCENHIT